jgi:hypothetical protein
MKVPQEMAFDSETIETLKAALDATWASLPSDQQQAGSRALLAKRILNLAA